MQVATMIDQENTSSTFDFQAVIVFVEDPPWGIVRVICKPQPPNKRTLLWEIIQNF